MDLYHVTCIHCIYMYRFPRASRHVLPNVHYVGYFMMACSHAAEYILGMCMYLFNLKSRVTK